MGSTMPLNKQVETPEVGMEAVPCRKGNLMYRQEARSTEPEGARARRVMGTPTPNGEAKQETER